MLLHVLRSPRYQRLVVLVAGVLIACACVSFASDAYSLAALWRLVRVGFSTGERFGWANHRHHREISPAQFSAMVREGASPPYRIHRLFYSTMQHEEDLLFMTPEWRAWVERHVESLELEIDIMHTDDQSWLKAAPHLGELRLASLRVFTQGWTTGNVRPLFEGVVFPKTLQVLDIEVGTWEEEHLDGLAIPASVLHLKLAISTDVHPGRLPALPPRLQTLEVVVADGFDVSEFVPSLPGSLRQLRLETEHRPALISSGAVERLSPQLRHNMLVYQEGTRSAGLPGLKWAPELENLLEVDLRVAGDYSGVVLPAGLRLRVFNSDETGDDTAVMFRDLAHWFPQLLELELHFPLALGGTKIPPALDVKVHSKRVLPPEVWTIPRVVLLLMWPTAANQAGSRLGQLRFVQSLELTLDASLGAVKLAAPPGVSALRVNLMDGASFPELLGFASVEKVTVEIESSSFELDPLFLPLRLVRLELKSSTGGVGGAQRKNHPLSQPVDLHHLGRLRFLKLLDLPRVHLGGFLFPDGLRTLKCVWMDSLLLDGVRFPPKLRRLHMEWSGLVDPWMAHDAALSTQVPVAYPLSLRSLELRGNYGLVPPPAEFVFPPRLRHLGVTECGIDDISRYQFPAVEHLDVSGYGSRTEGAER